MPSDRQSCRVCGHSPMRDFVRIGTLPVHIGVLWPDRDAALACPRGEIELAFCERCGFVYNTAFQPEKMTYAEEYDNALDFSPVFSDYARDLAAALSRRYNLGGGHVIDVGCGKGEFLLTLCEVSGASGTGFDPGAPVERSTARVEFVRDYYSRDHSQVPADLITCRHVFEHVDDPLGFLREIRAAIGERSTPVFFEVPSLRNIVAGNSPWEIIYEHCSYFGEEAMRTAFERAGFAVDEAAPLYNDLYLGLWARPDGDGPAPQTSSLDELRALVDRFASLFADRVGAWRERVDRWRAQGLTAVAWGAGARGTTFANLLDAGAVIPCLVDINPRKRGKYVPGTGQEIVAPERLPSIDPDVVVIMNPVYEDEIREMVDKLGIAPQFINA